MKRMKLAAIMVCMALTVRAHCGDEAPVRQHSNVARLALPRLKAVHDDVVLIGKQRRAIERSHGLQDFRCILHAHAEDSTHTGGTLPEMLADAKKVGVHAILLSDHYRPPRDFIEGRWRGMKDGVLFIPGSECKGFLIYPEKSILDRMELKTPEFVETVRADDGLIFLSHIEERPAHTLAGLTGLEIYNRHYDAKREMASLIALGLKLTDPKQLAELQEAVRLYPDEVFAFQCDYPEVYLKKWDEGARTKRLTGVAANDCHHNQVLLVKMVDENSVVVGTNVDDDKGMRKFTVAVRPGLREMMKGRRAGDILAKVDLDPYYISFRNSATHVLADTLDESTLRRALKAGHAYVSHDWMCDATGFQFNVLDAAGKRLGMMGDEVKASMGQLLHFELPVNAYVRLIRDGVVIWKMDRVQQAKIEVREPGVYRLEAWLKLDGELRPWIFSNPIYVR